MVNHSFEMLWCSMGAEGYIMAQHAICESMYRLLHRIVAEPCSIVRLYYLPSLQLV